MQKLNPTSPDRSERPWWREPMVWLVIGGPAVVVVAAVITAVIAIRGADEVLPHEDTTFAEKPALQGRNQAAAPDSGPSK
jgi:uncharacterized protein